MRPYLIIFVFVFFVVYAGLLIAAAYNYFTGNIEQATFCAVLAITNQIVLYRLMED